MARGTKNWRQVVAAVGLVLTIGTVAACGGSSSDDDGTTSAATASSSGDVSGTLTFYNFLPEGNEGRWWDRFVADFERRYPDAKVDVTRYSTEDYWTKTLAAFSSGDEPDVFIPNAGEDLDKYIRAGRIAALEEIVDVEAYNPSTLEPFKDRSGHLNGVPIYSYVILGWANEDLLAEHGVSVPRTWDELLAACGRLSAAGVTPLAMGNAGQDQFTTGQLQDALLYQFGGAGTTRDAAYGTDEVSWTDDNFVSGAEQMKALIAARCFPKGFTGMNYSQMTNLFAQGKAAMTFTGSWFADQVESSGARFRTAVFPLPDAPGATHSTARLDGILGGVNGLAASAKAAEKNPALVAAFLDSFGDVVDDYANTNSQLSVAADPRPQGSALQRSLSQVFSSAREIAPVSDTILPSTLRGEYNGNVVALTSGELTPEEWAKAMAETSERERPNFPELG